MSKESFTSAFQRSILILRFPRLSLGQASPPGTNATPEERVKWSELLDVEERSGGYYDEKLLCVCELSVSPLDPNDGSAPFTFADFQKICTSSQITTTCAFLSPPPPSDPQGSSYNHNRPAPPLRPISTARLSRSNPSASSVPRAAKGLAISTALPSQSNNLSNVLPPNTPNPMPSTREGDESYALSDGRVVWEGSLRSIPRAGPQDDGWKGEVVRPVILDLTTSTVDAQTQDDPARHSLSSTMWKAIWTGYIPLSFADLAPMNSPRSLLGVTATITLRSEDMRSANRSNQVDPGEGTEGGRKGDSSLSGEEAGKRVPSKVSAGTLRTTDLLQGLGGSDPLPSSRFKHVQDVLHPLIGNAGGGNTAGSTNAARSNLVTKHSGAGGLILGDRSTEQEPLVMAAAMRKSFRSVLPVLSALQIRMRTLPSIMVESNLTEHAELVAGEDDSLDQGQGEDRGRTFICVEAELGAGMEDLGVEYDVEDLEVIVGGSRKAALLWAPGEVALSQGSEAAGQLPLTIHRGEQHNFVFKTNPANGLLANWMSSGQETGQEHVRIAIKGRVAESTPCSSSSGVQPAAVLPYRTDRFSAIWNSVVDMRALAIPPKTARFDYADHMPVEDGYAEGAGGQQSAMMTAGMRSVHAGGPGPTSAAMTDRTRGVRAIDRQHGANAFGFDERNVGDLRRDLIMSATIVPMSKDDQTDAGEDGEQTQQFREGGSNDVKTFQPFMLEVIFLNLAEEVLKLMVSVCLDHGVSPSQTIIPLEQSTTLTPLQPSACQAVRLKCMPIGLGVLNLPAIEIHDLGRGMSCRAYLGMKVRAS